QVSAAAWTRQPLAAPTSQTRTSRRRRTRARQRRKLRHQVLELQPGQRHRVTLVERPRSRALTRTGTLRPRRTTIRKQIPAVRVTTRRKTPIVLSSTPTAPGLTRATRRKTRATFRLPSLLRTRSRSPTPAWRPRTPAPPETAAAATPLAHSRVAPLRTRRPRTAPIATT